VDVTGDVKFVISKALDIPIGRLTDETKLEDLGVESLKVIEMVFELEEKFDISITLTPDAAGRQTSLSTVGDVSRAVKNLVDAKAAG